MSNKIKAILMAAAVSLMVLTQGVSAAQFDDGEQIFTDGTESSDATGSVSALASALAKQTEEETQKFVEKEEEAAQIREERRVEKAEKASEQAEQDKTAALEAIQQTVEDARKKAEEEAEAQRVAKRQAVVDFALQFEGNPYVYGGTSLTNGADCSGFVMSVFANFGYSLPRVAADQCAASTKVMWIMWHFILVMVRSSMQVVLLQELRFPIMIMSSRQRSERLWNNAK